MLLYYLEYLTAHEGGVITLAVEATTNRVHPVLSILEQARLHCTFITAPEKKVLYIQI